MDKKVVFLDIDGTIVDFFGNIPESTKTAIRKARENGHYMVVCSGRSKFQIAKEVLDLGIDGIVAAAGAYVEYEGKVVYYNKDKEFGSIYQHDDDHLFFRQSDYIYDEMVEKHDVVEYSLMKTFDYKKQQPSSKAILLKTLYEDIHY